MSLPPEFPRRRKAPPPDPREVRVPLPAITAPIDLKRPAPPTALEARRARADHLCLWLGCPRALCRQRRHCSGRSARCVFEQADVTDPLLG